MKVFVKSSRIKAYFQVKSSDQDVFFRSKILIPVTDGSTRVLKVTTPWLWSIVPSCSKNKCGVCHSLMLTKEGQSEDCTEAASTDA